MTFSSLSPGKNIGGEGDGGCLTPPQGAINRAPRGIASLAGYGQFANNIQKDGEPPQKTIDRTGGSW